MADIEKLSRRPAEYLGDAGVPQLASGSVFFFLGCSVVVRSLLPKTFVAQEAPKWAGICLALGVFWAVKKLKQRVVFPRSGYAEPQTVPSARALLGIGIPVIILLPVLALLGYRLDTSSRLVWPALAIAFAVIGLASGIQQRSRLMICFGAYCVCLAPLLGWIPGDNYYRGGWLQVLLGGPVAVAGAFRLRSYLKANPARVEPANG